MRYIWSIILATSILFLFTSANAAELPQPLVNTNWLSTNLSNVFILDIRKDKESYINKPIYETDKQSGKKKLIKVGGHIPNSRLLQYKNMRGEQSINGLTIKHMIPEKNTFQNTMRQVGLNQDSLVVITSNAESEYDAIMAARGYWQLKYFGHKHVSILDGGTAEWLLDGHEISTSKPDITTGNWKAQKERKELLATSEEVSSAINEPTQLIDFRPLGQYLGVHKSSKVNEKGHISGAKSYPAELMTRKKLPVKFLSAAELQESSSALGINANITSITYCNSGHLAAGGWFMMSEILGNKNTKLYDGSVHQWTAEKRQLVKMKME